MINLIILNDSDLPTIRIVSNQRNNRVYYYLLQNKYTLILIIYSRESLSCKK